MSERYIPLYVRAWPDRYFPSRAKRIRRFPGGLILTFDCETTTDETQRLLFGFYRLSAVKVTKKSILIVTQHEGLFYADDLEDFYPEGMAALREYMRDDDKRKGKVNYREVNAATWEDQEAGLIDVLPNTRLEFMPASQFIESYLLKSAYLDMPGKRDIEPATIVGFNLPFDIWRITSDVSEEGGRSRFYGCFSGKFLRGRDEPWIPNYNEKRLGAKGMLMRMTRVRGRKKEHEQEANPPAYFVDLGVLTFALTSKPHSLRSAGETFGCTILKTEAEGHGVITQEYIDYARIDVAATENLYKKVMEQFLPHPISISQEQAYSPASIAKQYLRNMGIIAPLTKQPDFPAEILGRSMTAFMGGRSECRLRMTPVQAVLLDFTSMYPTIMILLGIWEMLTAAKVIVSEKTESVQRFLDDLTINELLNPATWKHLAGIAEIIPDRDDLFPVRSSYNSDKSHVAGIGINHVVADVPVNYTLLDLAASKIATGRTPQITRAWRFKPYGKQEGLQAVALYGDSSLTINPSTDNLFRVCVEQKQVAGDRHPKTRPAGDSLEICECSDCETIRNQSYWLEEMKEAARKEYDRERTKYDEVRHAAGLIGDRQVPPEPSLEAITEKWTRAFQEGLDRAIREQAVVHKSSVTRTSWDADPDKCLQYSCCLTKKFLKTFVCALYGVFAEMNIDRRSHTEKGTVYGLSGEPWQADLPETPGEYCFPPFASLITGGARLMLAMLERAVRDAGGQQIFCDTDSLCVAANPDGGSFNDIPHLSYSQIQAIRARFNDLNPYDIAVVPDLLKWELPKASDTRKLYCVAISAKRYALYHLSSDGKPELESVIDDGEEIDIGKRSEHGLGLYVNPKSKTMSGPDARNKDWIAEAWQYIISRHVMDREEAKEPEWLDRPAATRLTVTTPEVYRAFAGFNEGFSYAERVKPHNFMLAFQPQASVRQAFPKMRLIAPLTDPEHWEEYPVFDLHGDHDTELYLTTEIWDGSVPEELAGWKAPVKTYRDIITGYIRHKESKYDGPDGQSCKPTTRGILTPCTIIAGNNVRHIGKDSSNVRPEEVDIIGLDHHIYSESDQFSIALDVIRFSGLSLRDIRTLSRTTISPQTIQNCLDGKGTPRQEVKTAIIKVGRRVACSELGMNVFGKRRPYMISDAEIFTRWRKQAPWR